MTSQTLDTSLRKCYFPTMHCSHHKTQVGGCQQMVQCAGFSEICADFCITKHSRLLDSWNVEKMWCGNLNAVRPGTIFSRWPTILAANKVRGLKLWSTLIPHPMVWKHAASLSEQTRQDVRGDLFTLCLRGCSDFIDSSIVDFIKASSRTVVVGRTFSKKNKGKEGE